MMIKTYETARSHSLPLSKKGYWHLKLSMGGIYIYIFIYIYIYAQPPPKQKKTEPWGLQDLQWVWFLRFFFGFVFLCFLVFSKEPSPKSLQICFVGSMSLFILCQGSSPKSIRILLCFCLYEDVRMNMYK